MFYIQQLTNLLCFKTNKGNFHESMIRIGDIYFHEKYNRLYIITVNGFIDTFEYFSFNTIMKKDNIYDNQLFFRTNKSITYYLENKTDISFIDTPNISTFSKIDFNYRYIGNLFSSNKQSIKRLINHILTEKEKKSLSNDYLYNYFQDNLSNEYVQYIDKYLESVKEFMRDIKFIDIVNDEFFTINSLKNSKYIYVDDIIISPRISFKSYHQKDDDGLYSPYLVLYGYNQMILMNPKSDKIFNDMIIYLNEYGESSTFLLKDNRNQKINTYMNDFENKGLIEMNMYGNIIYPSLNDINYVYYNKLL